jgi:hypothetical protein
MLVFVNLIQQIDPSGNGTTASPASWSYWPNSRNMDAFTSSSSNSSSVSFTWVVSPLPVPAAAPKHSRNFHRHTGSSMLADAATEGAAGTTGNITAGLRRHMRNFCFRFQFGVRHFVGGQDLIIISIVHDRYKRTFRRNCPGRLRHGKRVVLSFTGTGSGLACFACHDSYLSRTS